MGIARCRVQQNNTCARRGWHERDALAGLLPQSKPRPRLCHMQAAEQPCDCLIMGREPQRLLERSGTVQGHA